MVKRADGSLLPTLLLLISLLVLVLAAPACEVDEAGGGAKSDTTSDVSGDAAVDVAGDIAVDTNHPDGDEETSGDSSDPDVSDPDVSDPDVGDDSTETQDEPCPTDYMDADGEPCQHLGQVCSGGCESPCQFCNALTCEESGWVWMEAFPDPACDCPLNPETAEGERCVTAGQVCSEPCSDPCAECSVLTCVGEEWTWLEAGPAQGCDCPEDFMEADGEPCSNDGQVCGGDCVDPCQFCNRLICEGGLWSWMEIFPDPNCGEECPAEPPIGSSESCGAPRECDYGEECCCGSCHPSIVCHCGDSGGWGCYATDACMIPECPVGPGECRRNEDCDDDFGGSYCVPPGTPQACGMCQMPEDICALDSDCATGQVCSLENGQCFCEPAMVCIPACQADADCEAGERCDAGHCGPIPCAVATDCPKHHSCGAGDPAVCVRQSCQMDWDCGEGACVLGHCYDELGSCQLPVP